MATAETSKAFKALEKARDDLRTAQTAKDWIIADRALKRLDKSIEVLREATSQQPAATAASTGPSVQTAEGRAVPAPAEGTEMRISDFFETVGEGVVAAQEQLDQRSKKYLAAKPELALPSVFRIPKASAEIHFAIEHTSKKGFNVLVYGASDTHQRQQQHKVSFDIISAPPPPDMLEQIETAKVRDVFVTGRAERSEIRDKMLAYANKLGETQAGAHARGLVADDIFPQVLVLRSEAFWALMLPRRRDDGGYSIDVAYVFSGPDKDPQLHGKWPPISKMDDRFNTLLELFLDLSKNQGRYLSNA
jgi:hypothetical protein